MKLFDTILFVLAVSLFIVGVHQSVTVGMAESYWIFMLCMTFLFMYGYRKNRRKNE